MLYYNEIINYDKKQYRFLKIKYLDISSNSGKKNNFFHFQPLSPLLREQQF